MSYSNMEIARKLKSLRELHGYTQEQIGKKIGVHKSTVMRWESGKGVGKMKLPVIAALAKIYETTPGELMGYDVFEAIAFDTCMYGGDELATPEDGELIKELNSRPLLRQLVETLSRLDDEHLRAFVTLAGAPTAPKDE